MVKEEGILFCFQPGNASIGIECCLVDRRELKATVRGSPSTSLVFLKSPSQDLQRCAQCGLSAYLPY